MTSSANAIQFVHELMQAAERLASHDLVVSRLWADWGHFGSWVIMASRGEQEDRRNAAIRSGATCLLVRASLRSRGMGANVSSRHDVCRRGISRLVERVIVYWRGRSHRALRQSRLRKSSCSRS